MIIKKFIQASVDLFQSNEIYHPNKKELIRQKLIERYVGICFQACYILEISDIIRISCTHLTNDRPDGSASIDVHFEVKCLILNPGEVFCNSKITNVHARAITAQSDYANIMIRREEKRITDKTIKVGQSIPITVIDCKYDVGHSHISVIGKPSTPVDFVNDNVCYEISGYMSDEEKSKIEFLHSEIVKLYDAVHKFDPKFINLFSVFLYPYKVERDINAFYEDLGVLEPMNMLTKKDELLNIHNGHLFYPNQMKNYLGNLYLVKSANRETTLIRFTTCSAYVAVSKILCDYYIYLNILKSILEEYNSMDKIDGTAKIYFKAYNEMKL
jgi:DNA-directed RNA polymerase subunit E'/Rpb7